MAGMSTVKHGLCKHAERCLISFERCFTCFFTLILERLKYLDGIISPIACFAAGTGQFAPIGRGVDAPWHVILHSYIVGMRELSNTGIVLSVPVGRRLA